MRKLTLALALFLATLASAQTPDDRPTELRPSDPEISRMLEAAKKAMESGNYTEGFAVLRTAYDRAVHKKFSGDQAILEDILGATYTLRGRLPEARQSFLSAYNDALTTGNTVLQADVLVALASMAELAGDQGKALDLATQAVTVARKSGNLYILSRALGELGNLQNRLGHPKEARADLEEALQLDRLNHFPWESAHTLYLAWNIAADPARVDEAMAMGTKARDLAIQKENYLVFIQASGGLSQGYRAKKQPLEAIALLERARAGLTADGKPLFKNQASFLAAASLPTLKIMLLSELASAHRSAGHDDEALKAWQELRDFAHSAGFKLAEAAAMDEIAAIQARLKQITAAIAGYTDAARLFHEAGNQQQELITLNHLASQAWDNHETEKAVAANEQILSVARALHDRYHEFFASLFIAEILQPRGETERTRRALEEATSLLSPQLTLDQVKPEAVLELFTRLSAVYQKTGQPLPQLIAIEKAMTPAAAINKVETMANVAIEVKRQLEAQHTADAIDTALKNGDFSEALSSVELTEHYEQTNTLWLGRIGEYKYPRGSQIIEILAKLLDRPSGAQAIEDNLERMGPVADPVRLFALVDLTRYHTFHHNPDKAIRFAREALSYPKFAASNSLNSVRVGCELAYAYYLKPDNAAALRAMDQCLAPAQKLGDPQTLFLAHQVNVWILTAAGRADQAAESSRYLLQQHPEEPAFYAQSAIVAAQQGRRAEAAEAWRHALSLYEAKKDQSNAALAHRSIAEELTQAGPASADEIRRHLEAAAGIYEQLHNPESQSSALAALGAFYAAKGDEAHSRRSFDAALDLARRAKAASQEALILSQIANAWRVAEEHDKALDYYRKSADVYHRIGNTAQEAFQVIQQAWALNNLHRQEQALETSQAALALADRSGAWLPRYWSRRQLASLIESRGDYEGAIQRVHEARDIAVAADQALSSAFASQSLAGLLDVTGEREQALDAVNLALPVFRRLHDTTDEVFALSNLISIYGERESNIKDFDKALEYYQAARKLVESKDPARLPELNLEAVEIYLQQGRFKDAAALSADSATYYRNKKDQEGEANALLSLAEALRGQKDLASAEATIIRAKPLVERSADLYLTGRFHYGLANLRRAQKRLSEAVAEYDQVVAIIESVKNAATSGLNRNVTGSYGYIYDELVDTWRQIAGESPQGQSAAAAAAFRYAELDKARVFTRTWGLAFLTALGHRLPPALQERERVLRARQSALVEELAQARASHSGRKPGQIEADLRAAADSSALRKDLYKASPAYAEARYPQPLEIADLPLRSGETLVEFKMLDDALLVWLVTSPGSSAPARIASFYQVAKPRAWFEERIYGIRTAFNRGALDQFEPAAAEELFNAIFPPEAARQITESRSLIIVPDGALFLLPFELLSPEASQSKYTLLSMPTTYYPSAAALRLARAIRAETATAKDNWPAQFFSIADPITTADDERYAATQVAAAVESLQPANATALPPAGMTAPQPVAVSDTAPAPQPGAPTRGGLPVARLKARGYFFDRLPETAVEANNIARLFQDARRQPSSANQEAEDNSVVVRSGLDARKAQFLQTDLARFRYIHFATHGFLPVEPGTGEPALILSYDGRNEDRMMLTLSEIVQLKLHAELVVLSACNTGSGPVSRAEGVGSLGSAFLAAGAGSVANSLWQVSDESTAQLMVHFYRNLLEGMSKSQALAAARATLYKDGKTNPFFWAPFILTGE